MINLNNQRFPYAWFYILGLSLFIGIIVWGGMSPVVTSATDKAEYTKFHENWTQIIDGESFELDDIKNFYPVEQGEKLLFTTTLPKIDDDDVLLFYTDNQEVVASVDNEIIQSFTMNEGYEILKTPGSAWNQIDLDCTMSGKTIEISFYSPVETYNNQLNNIYITDSTDVDSLRFEYIWLRAISAFLVFILTIIFFATSLIWKNFTRKRFMFAVGQFYLITLVVLLANVGFFEIFFGKPIISYLLGQLFRRVLPVAIWRLAVNSTIRFRHPKLLSFLRILVALDLVVALILQFVFQISFLESMWIHNLVQLMIIVSFTIMIVPKMINYKNTPKEEHFSFPLLLIFAGGIGDMIIANSSTGLQVYGGLPSLIATILYVGIVYFMLIKEDARLESEKRELEKSNRKLENTALFKQINIHFVFNTLNTISAYCKADPKEANRAIIAFSSYLRSYIDLVVEQDNVHILDEIELIENYLTIESIRFEDIVSFELDIEFDDFYLPPFTLQTIVENSVKHGLRKKRKKGKVTISTKEVGDFAQLTIEDTGIGFDTKADFSEKSVGIKNTKRRIEMMTNGTMNIDSQIGKGTIVTILIPKNGDGNIFE
ncbi:MAG: histidine kinase [Clostridia bacterium]